MPLWVSAAAPVLPAAEEPKRESFALVLRDVAKDLALRIVDLAHVDVDRVLFVAESARRGSRASTRPTVFKDTGTRKSEDGQYRRPKIKIGGKRVAYVIALRPKFFLDSTVEERVRTIIHELYHVAPQFDGRLAERRRHQQLPHGEYQETIDRMVGEYMESANSRLLIRLAAHGEVWMVQWLARPPLKARAEDRAARRTYTERDLFEGPVLMRTTTSAWLEKMKDSDCFDSDLFWQNQTKKEEKNASESKKEKEEVVGGNP